MTVIVDTDRGPLEIFNVPDDYPEFESETGQRVAHGFYWWHVTSELAPDSYMSGPFGSFVEAETDAGAAVSLPG